MQQPAHCSNHRCVYIDQCGVEQRPKFNFLEYGHVAYQIKANDPCINMIWNILPIDPPWSLGMGQKVKISTFSENGHTAYQIKGNDEFSKMQAQILS